MMKTKLTFYILILTIIIFSSCSPKQKCDINKMGTIEIKNKTKNEIEFSINNGEVSKLEKGEIKKIEQPAGTYSINFFSSAEVWNYNILVSACKTNIIEVP